MRPEATKLLLDMLHAAELIAKFTRARTWDEYASDEYFRSAVERQFEILGEALTVLFRQDTETASRISEHREIVSFRNVLIHGYSKVNHAVTWQVVQDDLPVLLTELRALLAEAEPLAE